ncbi:MAG: hypothetical protein HY556_03920 [Euryarchaeota archaeon]|nr:hypothetical protein [Euryarchaeota archaeon]
MNTSAKNGSWPPPWLTTIVIVALTISVLTGALSLLGWLLPHLAEGLLPNELVRFFSDTKTTSGATLQLAHWGAGIVLFVFLAVTLWRARDGGPLGPPPDGETATTAFWRWFFEHFTEKRLYRLHFRDALMYPTHEIGLAIAVAVVTLILTYVPVDIVSKAGLSLHRVNGLYMFFLAFYSLMVLVLRRHGPSPYPTILQRGRIVRRSPRYFQEEQ